MQPWQTLNAEICNKPGQMTHICTVLHMYSKITTSESVHFHSKCSSVVSNEPSTAGAGLNFHVLFSYMFSVATFLEVERPELSNVQNLFRQCQKKKNERPGFLCFYVQPNSASCNTEPYLQKTRVNPTCTTRKATPELQATPEHSCHCLC